jgi:hypothetical protein
MLPSTSLVAFGIGKVTNQPPSPKTTLMKTSLVALIGALLLGACTSKPIKSATSVSPDSNEPSGDTTSTMDGDFRITAPIDGKYWVVIRKVTNTWTIEEISLSPPGTIKEGQEVVTVASTLKSFGPWWPLQDIGLRSRETPRRFGLDGVYYKGNEKFQCADDLRYNHSSYRTDAYSPCNNTVLTKGPTASNSTTPLKLHQRQGEILSLNYNELVKVSRDTNLKEAVRTLAINQINKQFAKATTRNELRSLSIDAYYLDNAELSNRLKDRYVILKKEDYKRSYAEARDEVSLKNFIADYRDYDPNNYLPKASAKLEELQKKAEQAERTKKDKENMQKRIAGTRVCPSRIPTNLWPYYAGHAEGWSKGKLQIRVPVYDGHPNIAVSRQIGDKIIWEKEEDWAICEN